MNRRCVKPIAISHQDVPAVCLPNIYLFPATQQQACSTEEANALEDGMENVETEARDGEKKGSRRKQVGTGKLTVRPVRSMDHAVCEQKRPVENPKKAAPKLRSRNPKLYEILVPKAC